MCVCAVYRAHVLQTNRCLENSQDTRASRVSALSSHFLPGAPRLMLQVESMHATPHPEGVTAEDQRQQQATGAVGSDALSRDTRSGGGGGGNGIVGAGAGAGGCSEKGAVKVQPRRRKSTSLDGERRGGGAQQREVGYPMTSVAAVLRQLHMRVLSVEEMKMLDQVSLADTYVPSVAPGVVVVSVVFLVKRLDEGAGGCLESCGDVGEGRRWRRCCDRSPRHLYVVVLSGRFFGRPSRSFFRKSFHNGAEPCHVASTTCARPGSGRCFYAHRR